MKILGLDIGSKRIGVATSDESTKVAFTLCVIERRKSLQDDISNIKDLIKKYNISEIVVGLPLNMDGTKGPKTNEVDLFIEALKQGTGVPVISWDERLSTMQGEKILLEADMSRKKRKENIDKLAAQIILQGYLDYQHRKEHSDE